MTIDWWTLGLQAINVLILVWLLSRLFWRPVAQAIEARQVAAKAMLADGEAAQARAETRLADLTEAREGIAAERAAALAEAATQADAAARAILADARAAAAKLASDAELARQRDTDAARARAMADSAALAVDIARKLLARLGKETVQAGFLELLVQSIAQMSAADSAALAASPDGIDVVSAVALDGDARAGIATALAGVLGETPALTFLTDPDLIAGFDLRTAHFALRDSWQSDLATILRDLKHAT